MTRLWIIGAGDPEMERIEALLTGAGETVVRAEKSGCRVHPGNAYQADGPAIPAGVDAIFFVECRLEEDVWAKLLPPPTEPDEEGAIIVSLRPPCFVVDHHRPGDSGFGRPPAEFMAASSIGQVIAELARLGYVSAACPGGASTAFPGWPEIHCGVSYPDQRNDDGSYGRWDGPDDLPEAPNCGDFYRLDQEEYLVGLGSYGYEDGSSDALYRILPRDLVLCAAADHCLGAAYRGECPGVDPDALMKWRAESRAKFQGRAVDEILADIEATTAALRAAQTVALSTDLCPWHASGHRLADDCQNSRGSEWADDPCQIVEVADMRREPPFPELPEAATRAGVGYISGPLLDRSGRKKFTVSGSSDQVRAFMETWAPAQGLVDGYGDCSRGFAGAYSPDDELRSS